MASFVLAIGTPITVYVNKVKVDFPDQEPYVDINGRTLVPVRFVSEALGANVDWDGNQQTVTITKDQNKIVLTINKKTIIVNGIEKAMDTAAVATDQGRTMVPVRFVSEALGQPVGWDQDTYSAYIGEGAEDFNNTPSSTLGKWTIFDPIPGYSSSYFTNLAYGNGKFVLHANCDNKSMLFTSADGSNWKYAANWDPKDNDYIFFVNGIFISSSSNGIFWTSKDGINWSQTSPDISGEYKYFDNATRSMVLNFAYGNGVYVGVGQSYKQPDVPGSLDGYYVAPLIYTSRDAQHWQLINLEPLFSLVPGRDNSEGLRKVVFGNGSFIATSGKNIYKSWDGINWYKTTYKDYLIDITYANGSFWAIGYINRVGSYLCKSDDGISWSTTGLNVTYPLHNISYNNGTIVLTGYKGEIITSIDGETWTRQESGTSSALVCLTYGSRTFLTVIDSGIFGSNKSGDKQMVIMAKFE